MSRGRVYIEIISGVRNADDSHPDIWPAVGVNAGDGGETRVLEVPVSIGFGTDMILAVGQHPDKVFAPEILMGLMPPGAGIGPDETIGLGLQMIISGVKGSCEHAITQALTRRGWTEIDQKRFITEIAERIDEAVKGVVFKSGVQQI